MTHAALTPSTSKLVRDTRTGRMVEVRGVGALKGKLTLLRGVDLTKPIFEQVSKGQGRGSAQASKG